MGAIFEPGGSGFSTLLVDRSRADKSLAGLFDTGRRGVGEPFPLLPN